MKHTTAAIIAAMTLAAALTSCSEENPPPSPTPTDATTTATSTPSATSPESASPSPTESPTSSPSASPSLDEEQSAVRDVVMEFYRLQDDFGMDDSLIDLTPITNLTTGDAQLLTIASLEKYRELNAVQTAPVEVTITSIGEVIPDAGGRQSVSVDTCVDSSGVDVIDKTTGETVLTADREPVNLFTLEVVNENGKWLISTINDNPGEACS